MTDRFLSSSREFLLDECLPKIRLSTAALADADVWWRPHPGSNSIGNLILHLDGNARQWIISGIGGAPNVRNRDAEFAAVEGASGAALVAQLTATFLEIDRVLAAVPPDTVDEPRVIQGAHTTIFGAVFQVVTHVSMHTGQIIQIAKWRAPGAVKFYDAGSTSFTRLYPPTPRS
jgi:Protein of unknown function (DUF1572)